jgi:hypothetical protein
MQNQAFRWTFGAILAHSESFDGTAIVARVAVWSMSVVEAKRQIPISLGVVTDMKPDAVGLQL